MNLQDTEIEKLEIWGKLADKQLSNTRYFMGFSIVILIAGLVVLQLQYRPEANISLTISPAEKDFLPVLHAQGIMIKINKHGKGLVSLKSEHTLSVDNMHIYNELAKMRANLAAARSSEKALSEMLVIRSPDDAGFGRILREQ